MNFVRIINKIVFFFKKKNYYYLKFRRIDRLNTLICGFFPNTSSITHFSLKIIGQTKFSVQSIKKKKKLLLL